MKTELNIKEIKILLRVLLNEVVDFSRGSFFGVFAMDQEVIQLWTDYNQMRKQLLSNGFILHGDIPEIAFPDPYLADSNSLFKEGTLIYKTEHFLPLQLAIEHLLMSLEVWNQKESA